MPREWTEQQRHAITAQGGSILVSAAAGSGKTAVLVERVIRMITAADHPVDADRLLVVTFTRDAAAEMKQRIAQALADLLRDDPFDPQLLRQSKLLYTATICTIDSFCGDLVKEYFHTLGVSADYRIADQSELELLKAAAMDSAMEDFYNADNDGFSELLDAFSGKGGDKNLRDTVLKIHSFLETQPFPDKWLDDMLQSYGERRVAASLWGKIMIDYAVPAAAHCVNLCENSMRQLADADEKLREKLAPVIEDDLVYFQRLQEKLLGDSWDAIVSAVQGYTAKVLRAPRGYTEHPIKLAVAANRNHVKDTVNRLKKYFCRTEEEAHSEFAELQALVRVLFDLTRHYIERLDELKHQKNVLTFSDIELLAVRLLATPDGDGYQKTAQGEEISRRYDAVIVDEFQDVNDVQNLIFNCVSQNEENLFTVGDVKQCIYGFRQAKPQIFVGRKEHYARYSAEAPQFPATIILDKNFRSRAEVCDSVNFIFSRLMTKETAQMDYTADEYLHVGCPYTHADGCETELTLIDSAAFADVDKIELEAAYIARR
ncbi:MAG: UvrD-helicase domain-containing protein, partial [Ruminococcus sp.]|nr:UvrD-helicase domain-containing protein [Ruminococcus sp.]